MNQPLIIALLTIIFAWGCPQLSWAETVLEKVQRTGVFTAGVRPDAVPFSYTDESNELEGYAVDLIELIHRRLETELNQSIRLELQAVTVNERFAMVQNGSVDLLCSATSITPEREKRVDFSIPFFTSGIQLLVRAADATRLDPTQFSEAQIQAIEPGNVKIGLIQGTTADSDFRPIYPEATWQPIENRSEGVRRLISQEIDGIASDGILLLGEVWRQGNDLNQFSLVPQQPLTFENYGCIFPKENLQFSEVVNQTITSEENQQLWHQWFDRETGRFPYQQFMNSETRN
jgi:polar amino acid transport system substrate-binding protein